MHACTNAIGRYHVQMCTCLQAIPHLNILPELLCICNFSDLIEVLGVWNAQDTHAGLVPVLSEVPLKGPSAPIGRPPTDLTLELLVQTMQLVQPVGDGLAIPAQRQLQGVVNEVILLITVTGSSLLHKVEHSSVNWIRQHPNETIQTGKW